jgi:hypothetical protein
LVSNCRFWVSLVPNNAVLPKLFPPCIKALVLLVKNDAEVAFCAQDAVPNNDPVIPAVTVNEPVILELPCEKYPFFIMNSFAIPFPYPSMV